MPSSSSRTRCSRRRASRSAPRISISVISTRSGKPIASSPIRATSSPRTTSPGDLAEPRRSMSRNLEGHIARAFDGDLSSLHLQAVAMGALVIEQVQLAVNAYSSWDRATATLVLERERKINLYDAQIEEAALQ